MTEIAPDIMIDWIGGNCPVQAEGEINGRRFYFRARGEHWSVNIAPPKVKGYYGSWPITNEAIIREFIYEEEWGDGPYDAGWMPEEIAREMIEKAARIFVATEARND